MTRLEYGILLKVKTPHTKKSNLIPRLSKQFNATLNPDHKVTVGKLLLKLYSGVLQLRTFIEPSGKLLKSHQSCYAQELFDVLSMSLRTP